MWGLPRVCPRPLPTLNIRQQATSGHHSIPDNTLRFLRKWGPDQETRESAPAPFCWSVTPSAPPTAVPCFTAQNPSGMSALRPQEGVEGVRVSWMDPDSRTARG